VEADTVEDLDVDPALDDESFDEIEAIELGLLFADSGQVPTFWRRASAYATAAVESPSSFEDSSDGSNGRDGSEPEFSLSAAELSVDGGGAELAEVAGLSQFFTEAEDQLFEGVRGGALLASTAPPAREVHAIESLASGMGNPMLNGGEADAEAGGDGPHWVAITDGSHDLPAAAFPGVFDS
jgi:hypothetical protein